jgi:hypothetical protein
MHSMMDIEIVAGLLGVAAVCVVDGVLVEMIRVEGTEESGLYCGAPSSIQALSPFTHPDTTAMRPAIHRWCAFVTGAWTHNLLLPL